MNIRKTITIALMTAALAIPAVANAGLLGTYYNLSANHPDMQTTITGVQTGWVESALTGDSPTLTASGAANINQFDWWDSQYESFSRVDSDWDLRHNFQNSWFPVNEGQDGDPYHFAVKWTGHFYVNHTQFYNYSMGSDDDSWLFIDNDLKLDLGGIHSLSYTNYNVFLTKGWHNIDIFFAERHTVQSGFQLNFCSDLQPGTVPQIPEPTTLILLGSGVLGMGIVRRRRNK